MFSFGFWEILVIALIVLLVVGPDRLPALATFAGQWVGRLRGMARHMKSEIQQELEAEHMKSLLAEQRAELSELRRKVEDVRDEAEQGLRDDLSDIERDGDRARQRQSNAGRRQDRTSGAAPDSNDDSP